MQQGILKKASPSRPTTATPRAALAPAAFTIFQGIAAQHAELIGVGAAAMAKRGEFWLTVHTRVDFLQRAGLMDELTAATWPEPCDGKVRCYRSYSLHRGDALALGDARSGRPHRKKADAVRADRLSADFPFSDRTGITDPHPLRGRPDAGGARARLYGPPTDIDFGRHMNNVAYVRVLLDCFSAAELASAASRRWRSTTPLPVWRARIWASTAAVRRSGCRLAIKKADGKAAVLAAVKLR